MILQELAALYDRLADDPAYGLAKPGYSRQKITFEIVLRPDGTLHAIHGARIVDGKKKLADARNVPGQSKPSGQGLNPGFLWDNAAYLLGYKTEDDKPERTAKAFAAFRDKHGALAGEIDDPGFQAVAKFLSGWVPERDAPAYRELLDDAAATGFGVFRIQGAETAVQDSPCLKAWWEKNQSESEPGDTGRCLVSGKIAPIAKLHEPAIKGVPGAQSSGAKLVSYNCAGFTSYGKEQGDNAPVSEEAAFRYCNALNTLLSDRKHHIRIGDMAVVFWTEKPSPVESIFADLFDEKPENNAAQDSDRIRKLKTFWELIRQGSTSSEAWGTFGADPETRFHMIGLAPNAARISIRFGQTGTLGEFAEKLARHTADMSMIRSFDSDREHPPLWLLLAQTARDSDGIPPLLGGALLRAVLTGSPYPNAMARLVLNRIRADRKIDHIRCAFLKAYLQRSPFSENTTISTPIPMSLDTTRTDPAYRLGRLFAALEKTQTDALGSVNAGLRDRFYGAASATPSIVFPRILRTYQHHLGKLQGGQRVNREKLVQEILADLNNFPARLNLAEQGLFAIGYYHQTKDFYTKKDTEA